MPYAKQIMPDVINRLNMNIQENLTKVKQKIPTHCTLVAVSKTQPVDIVAEAYRAGQRVFGENKVQELTTKYEALPKDIEWHMIGHLQSNKVKYIAPFVNLIHGIDSMKLLNEVEKQGRKNNRTIHCLLQVHIAEEETKFGFDPEELRKIIQSEEVRTLTHVRIDGLMGMATFTDNTAQVRNEFKKLKLLFDELKKTPLPLHVSMNILSMGMSGDFEIALEEGSTLVRIGTAIFGERNYHENK